MPGSKNFDPLKTRRPFSGLFVREPRDEKWAHAVEQKLLEGLVSDLKTVEPSVTGLSVECRSTLCRVTWKDGSASAPEELRQLLRELYTPAGLEKYGNAIYLAYAGGYLAYAHGDSGLLMAHLDKNRAMAAPLFRSGKTPKHVYRLIPPERWPAQ